MVFCSGTRTLQKRYERKKLHINKGLEGKSRSSCGKESDWIGTKDRRTSLEEKTISVSGFVTCVEINKGRDEEPEQQLHFNQ